MCYEGCPFEDFNGDCRISGQKKPKNSYCYIRAKEIEEEESLGLSPISAIKRFFPEVSIKEVKELQEDKKNFNEISKLCFEQVERKKR